ncbi:MAG: efflux RND transporter periplasmic adaptor subunit [Gammaproteobacteria bacterium]|nr:efflux RND transporter periplasmic adaptor subunit [Gammaproteobacteria bacterium]
MNNSHSHSRPLLRAGVAGLLFLLVCAPAAAQRASLVTVDAVNAQAFAQTLPVVGRLVAPQMGAATTRVSGTLASMRVRVGEKVEKGQVLASIDTEALELQLALVRARASMASAGLKTAQAELKLAEQEVARLSGLTSSAAVSKAAIDDARQRHAIATAKASEAVAALRARQAEVKLAQLDVKYAEIKAPFAGAVTERFADAGGYLRSGDAVVQLVAASNLELEAAVPAERLGGLDAGAKVEIALDNGSRHRAIARAVVPEEDARTRTRRVRFSVDFGAGAGLLAAEQSATVFIPAGAPREIVSVHKDAIVRRGGDHVVFVVEKDAAAIRSVRVGAESGERIEVLRGLVPGELAVVRGNERLQPGQKVRLANAKAVAKAEKKPAKKTGAE